MTEFSRKPLYSKLAIATSLWFAGTGSCFAFQAEAGSKESVAQEYAKDAQAIQQNVKVQAEAALEVAKIEQAVAAGFSAVFLTVDIPALKRELNDCVKAYARQSGTSQATVHADLRRAFAATVAPGDSLPGSARDQVEQFDVAGWGRLVGLARG